MRRPSDGEAWTAGAFVQEAARDDPDATLLLPHALGKEEVAEIRVEYAGDRVLQPMGDDVFAVGARTSWYPNLGPFRDLATYRLTFQVPLGLQVVATGREVEASDADQRHVQVWESKTPIRVTGFNYGELRRAGRARRLHLDRVGDLHHQGPARGPRLHRGGAAQRQPVGRRVRYRRQPDAAGRGGGRARSSGPGGLDRSEPARQVGAGRRDERRAHRLELLRSTPLRPGRDHAAVAVVVRAIVAGPHLHALPRLPRQRAPHADRRADAARLRERRADRADRLPRVRAPVVGPPGGLGELPRRVALRGVRRVHRRPGGRARQRARRPRMRSGRKRAIAS